MKYSKHLFIEIKGTNHTYLVNPNQIVYCNIGLGDQVRGASLNIGGNRCWIPIDFGLADVPQMLQYYHELKNWRRG